MRCHLPFLQALFLTTASALPNTRGQSPPPPFPESTNSTTHDPPVEFTSWKVLCARSLQLPDDSLLMTWEHYSPEPPAVSFPVYKSTDGGASWTPFSNIQDTINGWGFRYNPVLFELPQDIGEYAAGTILAAGESLPADFSEAWIDFYASTDGGVNWEFVSHVAYGPGNNARAQKLVHVTSADVKTWSEAVEDVAHNEYENRPSMPIVACIDSINSYIMTYEVCGPPGCAAYYKVSPSPLGFNKVGESPLVSNSGIALYGSPYVIHTTNPADGTDLIIASYHSQEPLYLNDDSANPDTWKMVNIGQWAAYSRELRIINVQGTPKLMLSNGGNMGDTENNYVCNGVVAVPIERKSKLWSGIPAQVYDEDVQKGLTE
ncbi:hypothetical protein FQN55_004516 [Onygenales sp. PD_40]|nr:hypothetical protein FQN55_004516 [Onygenales sp. PD_40]